MKRLSLPARCAASLAACALSMLAALPVSAQTGWPARALRLIVAYPTGGTTDAVARLLAQRMVVMQGGYAVESGLTDQVLDDPQHPYTQLLVSSVLPP